MDSVNNPKRIDPILGHYQFTIRRDGEFYIAKGSTPDGKGTMITQGKSPNEIFDMIADAYKTIHGVTMRGVATTDYSPDDLPSLMPKKPWWWPF